MSIGLGWQVWACWKLIQLKSDWKSWFYKKFNDYLISLKHMPKIKTNTTNTCSQIKTNISVFYYTYPMSHIDSICILGFDKGISQNVLSCLNLNICWCTYFLFYIFTLQKWRISEQTVLTLTMYVVLLEDKYPGHIGVAIILPFTRVLF